MLLPSILKVVLVTLNTALVAPMIAVVALVDECAAHHLCRFWARVTLVVSGVQVRVHRLAALDPARPYVFMSNHRSQYDIPAVIAALPEFQLRWVAKKELTRVPVFGWALRRSGHIIIDRSDHRQSIASLRAARAQMLRGISVTIFPEGTRSPGDQALLPLKKGGFMLALETGFPIVPIAVCGSDRILPRGSWRARSGDIDVVIGAPLPVAGVPRDELIRRVRTFMLEHLGEQPEHDAVPVAAEAV